MEVVLKDVQSGDENIIQASLLQFIDKNATNFNIGETCNTRKEFCKTLLSHIETSDSSKCWSQKTLALALTALKIFAREKEGIDQLISREGLTLIMELALLTEDKSHSVIYESEEKVEVLVEAVKCLCNILLNNQHLASALDHLGCLNAVTRRLSLCHVHKLPYQLVQFDLRFLFLITACGTSERIRCRDECDGILIMINVIDSILFGPSGQKKPQAGAKNGSDMEEKISQSLCDSCVGTQETNVESLFAKQALGEELLAGSSQSARSKNISSRIVQYLAPMRETVYCLPSVVDDKRCVLLHDALKILFNQTLGWVDKECEGDDLVMCNYLAHLLKILLLSIQPVQASNAALQTIVHTVEVLVNIPEKCASCLLIPSDIHIMQSLCKLHPSIFGSVDKTSCASCVTNAVDVGDSLHLYQNNFDQIFDNWNMATIISLLNFLDRKLSGQIERHGLSPLLTALRLLSKGHRSIRRFLKSEIFPPLHEIEDRPEVGDSLKSKLVRLMVAGTHGAEEVTSEFLFVLCKENANRLVKHTGYGNAAGLLLAHGLLAGGVAADQGDYSSDSEVSDTEEYNESKEHIDPVTGGPIKQQPSSLDEMTDEEREREAEKLEGLLRKLDEHGIIKVMPLDQHRHRLRHSEDSDPEHNEANQ